MKNKKFLVYQFNEMFEDFVELILDPDVKSEDLLDDDLILLLVDNQQFKVWLWEGYNTTKRM
ncbi:unnamed protein product, partial [marine sediment metagenome]